MAFYRCLFALAAAYNLAFGIWAGFAPQSFFTLFALEPPRYPAIWQCLGMVVGVYALAYAYGAWSPDRGDVFIAIGLIGKVLGPAGWLVAVAREELPPRTFPLILANDLIWWFPFLFYLLRHHPACSRIVTALVVAVHILACAALLLAAGGTEIEPEMQARQRWVTEHTPLWATTWLLWTVSSLSLLAFVVIWSRDLIRRGVSRPWVVSASLLVAVGVPCDLVGETINIPCATRREQSVAEFTHAARRYTLWSAATANGLY